MTTAPVTQSEAGCPRCGHVPLDIDVTSRASGSGGLQRTTYAGQALWLIPLFMLDTASAYEADVSLRCSACDWEAELDDSEWEAGS